MSQPFDRRHVFQFVTFFQPRNWTDEEVQRLVTGLNATDQASTFGLLLRRNNIPRPSLPPQLVAFQPFEFVSGAATWRATWTPERLDVFFDALVVASNGREAPSLESVAEIVTQGFQRLAAVPENVMIAASRFALVTTIESTREDAEQMLSELTGMPVDGFTDFHVRRSRREDTPFEPDFQILTNRLETFSANSLLPSSERSITVQYDVNTAAPNVQYTLDEFGVFLNHHVPTMNAALFSLAKRLQQ